jgi:hypothetical protein
MRSVFAERRYRLSIAVGHCPRNVPFICREKAVSPLGYYAAHYKHVRASCFASLGRKGRRKENQAIVSFDKDSVDVNVIKLFYCEHLAYYI